MNICSTIETDAGTFRIEVDDTDWHAKYRMHFEDRVTEWGTYENPLMIGDHVAVSPYYTEFDNYIICTPFEACQYICTQEKSNEEVQSDSSDGRELDG